jgi:UDP:flavonoid glycosyltransferase YjiC (YdhE family)
MLMATWDGAGNFPPERALVHALATRGHALVVLGHLSQRDAVEADGVTFLPLTGALDSADRDHERSVFQDVMMGEGPGVDLTAAIGEVHPDLLLVDCALTAALRAAKASGLPTVALVHTLYSFIAATPFREPTEACDLILVFSYRRFDAAASPPANVAYVGPLRPPAGQPTPWPRRFPGRPFVIASLSTSHQRQEAVLQTLCDALGGLEAEAVVTSGRGIAPEALAAADNVTVVRHVEHEAVLGQADLLITHAGHGTAMAGASAGVPMLCLPMGRDQPRVAAEVVRLGLGASLDPAASVDELRGAITALLADEGVRPRSRAFAEAVAGETDAARAAALVEALLAAGARP